MYVNFTSSFTNFSNSGQHQTQSNPPLEPARLQAFQSRNHWHGAASGYGHVPTTQAPKATFLTKSIEAQNAGGQLAWDDATVGVGGMRFVMIPFLMAVAFPSD